MNLSVILAGVAVVVLGAGCAVDRSVPATVRLVAIIALGVSFLAVASYPLWPTFGGR